MEPLVPPKLVNARPIIDLLENPHSPPPCAERELPGIWRFQLRVSLSYELRSIDPAWGVTAEQQGAASQPPIRTFEELLRHPRPPLHLLEMVKEYAKIHLPPSGLLPPAIAGALYLLAIALARGRCGVMITSMSEDELNHRLAKLRQSEWLDEPTIRLIAACGF